MSGFLMTECQERQRRARNCCSQVAWYGLEWFGSTDRLLFAPMLI